MKRLIALGIMDGEIDVKPIEILKFPSVIGNVLKCNGVKAAYKALDSLDDRYKKTKMLCLADVAESVLHIYEKQYPNDLRVRNCINGVRDYCNDKISEKELNILKDDDYAAFCSVDVVANVACVVYAAYAATNAIDDNFAAVAACTNNADSAVVDNVGDVASAIFNITAQWQKNEDILKKYI